MASNSIRFIKERRLLSLIGVEYALASETKVFTKGKLYATCCFVLINALLALASMYYAFDNLFESVFIGMLLALFFAALFFNLYVFLIQTFSKHSLAYEKKKTGVRFSNITRVVFVLFIGFIVSSPLSVFLLEKSIASNIEQYKQELIHTSVSKNAALHNEEIKRLNDDIVNCNLQVELGIRDADAKLKELQLKKQREEDFYTSENDHVTTEINNSVFFLKEIQVALTDYKISWIFTGLVLLMYAMPVFLVQSISSKNEYFIKRTNSEIALIRLHYKDFKKAYTSIFEKFGLTKTFHESYTDAPFNTEKPPGPELFSQDEFLKQVFNNSKKG